MPRVSPRTTLLGSLVLAALVFLLGPLGSSQPDGLSKVAQEEGFAPSESEHALDDAPVAGYRVEGIRDGRTSRGAAGVVGVVVTFVLGTIVLKVARRRRPRPTSGDGS
ncbi:MAG TPA: PDGLE domain-containing protein [Actinomycetota bacterium]|nr:PDGLE domain-containing protein [Actinomycetota bacterium]